MANRITTTFDFQERGQGLKKIKADVANVDGAFNKAKVTAKGAWAEFANNRYAQAAVAGAATKIAHDAVNAASNLQESMNAVNVTFGDSADEINKIGETSARSLGLSQRSFNEAAVQFSSFAQTVAGEGGDVAGVIQEITQRAADFASVHNIDVSEAMRVFQSAMAGETEPIKRYGKDLSAAAVNAHAYASGIAEAGAQLTEAQKQQARYSLLLKVTADTADDFANTSDSLANSQKILAAETENAQATIGEALLPVTEAATGAMVELAGAVDRVDRAIQGVSGGRTDLGSALGAAVTDILMGNQALSAAADKLWENNDATVAYDKTLSLTNDERERSIAILNGQSQTTSENTRESRYNADAHDEMRIVQDLATDAVDRATEAQEKYLRSIKHTRDEVGKLKRDIDDEQAWIAMQEAFDSTDQTMRDVEASALDQRSAIVDLKEEVLLYGEALNLPDKVITELVAMVERGALNEVEALLARWGNGVTLPIKPVVIGNSRGTNIRVDESGNVRLPGRARGGPVRAGQSYVVGENEPEILTMGGNGYVTPMSKLPAMGASGGVTIGQVVVQAPAGADADAFGRAVREAIRRETRWSGPVTGWSAA